MTTDTDFHVTNHGSICVLTALTDGARDWVNEHLPEDRQTWGTDGTVVEPRYLPAILDGLGEHGFVLEVAR